MSSGTDSPVREWGKVLDTEELLRRFDRAWNEGSAPRIELFLPPANATAVPIAFVRELVLIDLEYRWRKGGAGGLLPQRPRLEDYAACYPVLGDPRQWPEEWIAEEYRARCSWGQLPNHIEYFERFPPKRERLQQVLTEVDVELAAEENRTDVSPSQARVSKPASISSIREALRSTELLTAQQLEQLAEADSQDSLLTAEGFLHDLVRRGWLTPYQATLLRAGRHTGLTLGAYVILDLLGQGATGQVFKARHRKMGRVVALKVIRAELLADSEVLRRFYREIEVVSRLDHPNVVRAYDAGPVGNTHVLAMEYVEGIDLAGLVKNQGPLPVAQACEYVRQTAHGLQHAHEKGLVHRDIKPSNLFLSFVPGPLSLAAGQGPRTKDQGQIKILDLGLARLRRPTPREGDKGQASEEDATNPLTAVGAVMMGTPDYLAPEQALHFHGADIRADLYSLGCTFYFLLTGEAPFAGFSLPEKLLKHQQAEPPRVRERRPDVPVEAIDILDRMLAKRPEDRYSHPREVADALADVLASLPSKENRLRARALRTRQLVSRAMRAVWKRRRLLATAAVLLPAILVSFLLTGRFRPVADRDNRGHGTKVHGTDTKTPGRLVTEERVWKVEAPVASAAVSRDNVLAAAVGNAVRLWDAATGKEISLALTHPGKVNAVAFSPDGKYLATGCDDQLVRLWGLTSATLAVLKGQNAAITCLAFAPNGRTLASGGDHRTLLVWDVAKRRPLKLATKLARKLNANENLINCVVFDPENKWLASCDPAMIYLWGLGNLREGAVPERTPNRTRAAVVRFIPPDRPILVAGGAEGFRLLDVPSFKRPAVTRRNPGTAVRALDFSADGLRFASGGPDGSLRLWDFVAFKQTLEWKAHDAGISDVIYSPDGTFLVTASADGSVKLWIPGKHEKMPIR